MKKKILIIAVAAVLVLALVLTFVLVSCNKKAIEVAEPSIESTSFIEESVLSEETTSAEESSESESSEEESSKIAASSQPTGIADERMNSRAFYDALVPKATAMGYKCEWVGTVVAKNGFTGLAGKFTLSSGYWVQVQYYNDEYRDPVAECFSSAGGPAATGSRVYEACFNKAIAVLEARKGN